MYYPNDNFSKICDVNGNCHCDWRYSITDCVEASAMRTIHIACAATSGFASIIIVVILYHRVVNLGQTILDYRSVIPRPKPIETMGVFGLIFNILRMIQTIVLVTDVVPNFIFRAFIFELPWQFGFAALACYFFGIAYTLSDSSRTLYDAWIRSPIIIDVLSLCVIFMPFVTNNWCSIAAGIYAQQGNIALAARAVQANYYLWAIYTTFLGIFIVFAGVRLIRLLSKHLLQKNDVNIDAGRISTGALKVKIIVVCSSTCLLLFSGFLFWYTSDREDIIVRPVYNIAGCVVCTFNGVVATLILAFAVTLNPQMAGILFRGSTHLGSSVESPATTIPTGNNTVDSKQIEWNSFSRLSLDKSIAMQQQSSPRNTFPYVYRPDRIEEEQSQYNAITTPVRTRQRSISPTFDENSSYVSGSNCMIPTGSRTTILRASRGPYSP